MLDCLTNDSSHSQILNAGLITPVIHKFFQAGGKVHFPTRLVIRLVPNSSRLGQRRETADIFSANLSLCCKSRGGQVETARLPPAPVAFPLFCYFMQSVAFPKFQHFLLVNTAAETFVISAAVLSIFQTSE